MDVDKNSRKAQESCQETKFPHEECLIRCEARVRDTIRIRYYTDTPIRKNFKNQDTIRLRYVNKKNYIIKCTI